MNDARKEFLKRIACEAIDEHIDEYIPETDDKELPDSHELYELGIAPYMLNCFAEFIQACERKSLSPLVILSDMTDSIKGNKSNNVKYVSHKFRFADADKKTYLDLKMACECLGLPTTIQIVNSHYIKEFGEASTGLAILKRDTCAVPIGLSYYIPVTDSTDLLRMRGKELIHALTEKACRRDPDYQGDYIKLEFVLPYNDSIQSYLPEMETQWENYMYLVNSGQVGNPL